jgi:general secretion pathway protein F
LGAFEYTAVDAAGRERKGVLEGDTARQVRQLLRDQALLPVEVSEVTQTESRSQRKQFSIKRGVSASDLSLLTRQIATLVRSGLPLEEALQAVSEQTEKPRVRSIVMGVRAKVMEGHALADGLSDFPTVFDELYIATVAAGEQSGHLDTVLERLADYTESREQMRSRTMNAMLYPVMLFIVCISIVALLLTFVVPKIVKQFENSKAELPMLTQALIAISDFLRDWGLLLLAVLVLAG